MKTLFFKTLFVFYCLLIEVPITLGYFVYGLVKFGTKPIDWVPNPLHMEARSKARLHKLFGFTALFGEEL